MKRKLCLILALVLAFALTGCGSSAPESSKVEPPAQTKPVETEPTENPLRLGRMDGGSYINTYAGIGCDLDESWTFYGADELQEIPAAARESMEGSELAELVGDYEQITDMMAENAELMVNVNVLYTKQPLAQRVVHQTLSEEGTLDLVLDEQKDLLVDAYEQAGIHVSSLEKVKATFLGEEHWALKTTAETQGVPVYFLQVANYKLGAYGVTLTVSSFVEDNTQTVLDLFYPVD